MRETLAAITLALAVMFLPATAEAQESDGLAPDRVEGVRTVTPAEAKALWERDVKFIDVRGPLYDEGHIPGAVQLNFIGGFNEASLKKVAKVDAEIVIYCGGIKCTRSPKACAQAVGWGYSKIYWFREGFPGWVNAGYPTVP